VDGDVGKEQTAVFGGLDAGDGAIPPVSLQRSIVERSERLETLATQLEAIYRRKRAALEELKQSLLHQALNGDR